MKYYHKHNIVHRSSSSIPQHIRFLFKLKPGRARKTMFVKHKLDDN